MGKGRLEAFSDGVIAIIITIMVLELHAPKEPTFAALLAHWPVFLSYALSFVFVGIYWGNHHHLLHSVKQVTPSVIWGNLGLLFFLSLVLFVTGWLGTTRGAPVPTAVYGSLLIACGLGYQTLQTVIASQQTDGAGVVAHARNSKKGLLSLCIYAAGVGLAFVWPPISVLLYATVSLLWLIPERAFERIGQRP